MVFSYPKRESSIERAIEFAQDGLRQCAATFGPENPNLIRSFTRAGKVRSERR